MPILSAQRTSHLLLEVPIVWYVLAKGIIFPSIVPFNINFVLIVLVGTVMELSSTVVRPIVMPFDLLLY